MSSLTNDREPGQGAAEQAEAAAEGTPVVIRALDRLARIHTDERAWRLGAKGERRTAKALARLERQGWLVVHDLTVGSRGANLDHVAVGPSGVWVIDSKYTTGRVHLWARTLKINGYRTSYLAAIRRQVDLVQRRLRDVVGFEVPVHGVICLVMPPTGTAVKVHAPAEGAHVVHVEGLARKLKRTLLPEALSSEQLDRIRAAVLDPEVWRPRAGNSAGEMPVDAGESEGDDGDAQDDGDAEDDGSTVELKRWNRFGHDRVYANGVGGEPLGYVDLLTGVIEGVPNGRDDVTDLLTGAREELAAPAKDQPVAGAPDAAEIKTSEWRRFGNHRIYANTAEGGRLGWMDVPTGEVQIEPDVPDPAAVKQALQEAAETARR